MNEEKAMSPAAPGEETQGAAPPEETPPARPARRSRAVKAFLILAIVAALAILVASLGRHAGPFLEGFAEWVKGLGIWAPLVFIAGYAIVAIAMLPAFPLTIASGAIFGLPMGVLYTFIGASIGACCAFLISRYVARGAIERRLQGSKKFAAVDRAIGERGLFICLLLRLSPAFPFNLMNYGLGLTKVRFSHYAVACMGMLPGTLLYVYVGFAAGDIAAALSGASEREKGPFDYALLVLGLVATVFVTTWVTRIARRALKEATGDGTPADSPA